MTMKIPFHLLALASTSRAWVQRSAISGARTIGAIRQMQMANDGIQSGVVKWFDSTKGFGFIVPDNATEGGDVFVHQTAIQTDGYRTLAEGERVEYVVETDPKNGRRKALNVTGPNGSAVQGKPFRPSNDFNSY